MLSGCARAFPGGFEQVRPVALAGTFIDWSGCNLLGGPGDFPGIIPAIPPGKDQEPAGWRLGALVLC